MRSYLTSAALAATAFANDSCKILVLSGGGSNGAWEMGVFYGLVNYGNADDFTYDVVSGISAGSINTLAFAGWDIGKEKEAAQWGSDLWKNLKTSDVWQNWTLSIAEGLTMKAGLLDNSPLLAYMQGLVKDNFTKYGRRVSIGSANVNTGEFHVFDQKNTALEDLARASFASASIPTVFPPYNWEGIGLFMDGGTIYNVNIQSAIEQCMEIVDDESKITIDVFVCDSPQGSVEDIDDAGKTIENVLRSRKIHSAFHGTNELTTDKKAHSTVNWRYLVYQTQTKAGGISELEFNGDKTWPMQEQGRQDAQTALNAGESTHFELFDSYADSDELRSEFETFGDFMNFI